MPWTDASVALLDINGRFPDRFAPPSVASDKADAEAAAAAALASQNAAAGSAGTASTQAGIATTQAGTATTQAGIATTQAGLAATAKNAAVLAQGVAESAASAASGSAGAADDSADAASSSAATASGYATTASGHATTATTQAGIATTQAGLAAGSAGTATTQAGTATTQAGNASASAAAALVSENNAAATLANAVTKTTIDAKGDLIAGTADNTYARLAVGASGGSLVADSTQAAGLRWTTALRLEGTGSPEGVKTAPIGSTYTDSAATNGAVTWVKVSGAGNTGWAPSHADTGWRNVRADIDAQWTCDGTGSYHLYIRRFGNTVQLQGKAQANTTAARNTSILLYTAPAGFRGVQFPVRGTVSPANLATFGVGLLRSSASAQSIEVFFPVSGNWTVGDVVYFQGSWVTTEEWPAALPGSAV